MHSALEKYILGTAVVDIQEGMMPIPQQLFFSMKKLLDENLNCVYYQEQTLFSRKLWMAGRTDLIGFYDGELAVIDYKSSGKPKKKEWIEDYFVQCTAYALMHEEQTGIAINKIVVLIGVEGAEPQVFVERTENYITILAEYKEMYDCYVPF